MVRCPACKSVFSPEQAQPAEPVLKEKPKPRRTKPHRNRRDDEDEEEYPRAKKTGARSIEEETENRDVDLEILKKKPKKRRKFDDVEMSEKERADLKAAFERAAWGAKLIWLSIVLFMVSMVCIVAFFFQAVMISPTPAFLYMAGGLGLINWVLGAIGVGLCLSGPPSKGHWGFGIAAAVAVGIHLLMLFVLVATSKEPEERKKSNTAIEYSAIRSMMVATRLDAITLYLSFLVYPEDQDIVPKDSVPLSTNGFAIAVGVMEMVRIILMLMLLSCLALSAGDEELSRYCTRAGGTASLSPGLLSILMLFYVVFVVETNSQGTFMRIVLSAMQMGIYAILAGCMLRALMAVRETADACEEPFKSQSKL